MGKDNDIISERTIRKWLDNYDLLVDGKCNFEIIATNSGPRNPDGISNSYLNRIMLQDAIKKLPGEIRNCVVLRWIKQVPLRKAASMLGVNGAKYYKLCDAAVRELFITINGIRIPSEVQATSRIYRSKLEELYYQEN
jgi:DNA-directed RNA polymerase specialized sigma24 family protein